KQGAHTQKRNSRTSRSRVATMHTSLALTGLTSSNGAGRFNEESDHDRSEPGEADQSTKLTLATIPLLIYNRRETPLTFPKRLLTSQTPTRKPRRRSNAHE